MVEPMLSTLFICSSAKVEEGEGGEYKGDTGVGVTVKHASGKKCERCWTFTDTVGECAEHPTLCRRCSAIIKKITVD